MLRSLVTCLLLSTCVSCDAAPVIDSGFDILDIVAERASEDPDHDIMRLAGQLSLQTRKWRLEAEQAIVFGPVNKPDRVRLEGSPVRLRDIGDAAGEGGLEASAPVMEYLRENDTLVMSGGAMLRQDRQVLRSAVIEYDIGTGRFRAGGAEGVTIEAPPVE